MNALKKPLPRDMTVDEFLSWAATVDGSWQLRDGVPEMMDPAADVHGSIRSELAYLLVAHLRQSGRPCRVVTAPGVIPGVRPRRNMLIPDIGVTCAPPTRGVPLPDPVAVIEILSPSNKAQKRANIAAFKTIASVLEIMLISSLDVSAELLRRQPDGAWPDRPDMLGADDRLVLASIGFDEKLHDAYRTTVFAAATGREG
jgi:Uma2 family endonuclease